MITTLIIAACILAALISAFILWSVTAMGGRDDERIEAEYEYQLAMAPHRPSIETTFRRVEGR